MKMHEIFAIGH